MRKMHKKKAAQPTAEKVKKDVPMDKCTTCKSLKPATQKKCQTCKTAMRSVIGACCCGGMHPNCSIGHNAAFWDLIKKGQVYDHEVTDVMKERFLLIRDQHPDWTEHAVEDVLTIDRRTVKEAIALRSCVARIPDLANSTVERDAVYSRAMMTVQRIADNFCYRRFTTITTRFSKFRVVRRTSVTPVKDTDIIAEKNFTKVPWKMPHFYARIRHQIKEENNGSLSEFPQSFGEDMIKLISTIGYSDGVWKVPVSTYNAASFLTLNKVVDMLLPHHDQQALDTGRSIDVLSSDAEAVAASASSASHKSASLVPSPRKRPRRAPLVSRDPNTYDSNKAQEARKISGKDLKIRPSSEMAAKILVQTPLSHKPKPSVTPRTALANNLESLLVFDNKNPQQLQPPTSNLSSSHARSIATLGVKRQRDARTFDSELSLLVEDLLGDSETGFIDDDEMKNITNDVLKESHERKQGNLNNFELGALTPPTTFSPHNLLQYSQQENNSTYDTNNDI